MNPMLANGRKILLITVLILITLSCAVPLPGNAPTPQDDLQATIAALETQVSSAVTDVSPVTDVPHSIEETATMLPPATVEPEPLTSYRGFVAWRDFQFTAYDFSGASLGFQVPSGSDQWYGDNEVSVLPDAIYYSMFDSDKGVFRVDASGTQSLNFIDSQNPVSISVNQDASLIAWATYQWTESAPNAQIFIANMDGSNQRLIDQILPTQQSDGLYIFHPLRWTEDNRLIYATGMTGIGGYLLFWGYNGMKIYDPGLNVTQILVDDSEHLGLCLSSISQDLDKVAIVCGNGSHIVRVRTLNSGEEIQFPSLPDQNGAGSAKFSPAGNWLAYVIQRVEPDNEFGQVVVVAVDGSSAPLVIDQVVGGKFSVEGWIDDDSFLVTRSVENVNSIWKMSRDGIVKTNLGNGKFVGFFPQ